MKSKKQKLILPQELSEDLAEETGIHIGDGSMGFYKSGNKNHWCYTFCCHEIDDKEYYGYVKRLIKKLYNLDPVNDKRIRQDTTKILRYTRKELILFKKKLGLPLGNKATIKIPEWILKNESFKIACIRGIFDTDGSVVLQKKYRKIPYYPHLKISSKSKGLAHQINNIISSFEIKSSICASKRITKRNPNIIWYVEMYGESNFKKYAETFGFSNLKHLKKYKKWEKSGGDEI